MLPGYCICPKCLICGPFIFTGGRVLRGVVWLNDDQIPGYQQALFPVARCNNCGFRTRVLSCEVLPYKTYTLPVIEHTLKKYLSPETGVLGLRQAVEEAGGDHPHFSTLHRWLAGLGERILDRPTIPAIPPSHMPTSALFAETKKRLFQALQNLWQRDFSVPAWKYKSARRCDQLLACLKLVFMASCLFAKSPYPLTKWNAWLITHFHVAAWGFPTGLPDTPIQHPNGRKNGVKDSKHLKREVPYDSRSPPNRLLEI